MKNVALVESGLTSGNITTAKDVLGLIPDPKTKWNVGSLIGSMISSITVACIVVISNTKIKIFEAVEALDLSELTAIATNRTHFTPDSGTTRVRAVNADNVDYGVTSDLLDPTTRLALADFVAKPSKPTYSINALVAKILSWIEDPANEFDNIDDYVIVIDQVSGKVSLFDVLSDPVSDVLDMFQTGTSPLGVLGELKATFDLTDPDVPDEPVVEPTWG